MTTTLIRRTAGQVAMETARLLGDPSFEESTATAGAAGTITGGNLAIPAVAARDSHYNDMWIYIYGGTSAGDERYVSAYAGTTRVLTIVPNWTSTPDSTSNFILLRQYRPSMIFDAVVWAIREAARMVHTPLVDTSLVAGNILYNGHFEEWDGSSSVSAGTYIDTRWKASDGWAVRGTSATAQRNGSIIRNISRFDQYGAQVDSSGTNEAYLEQVILNWSRWAGETMSLRGWAYASTASRVRLRCRDGVTTFLTTVGGTSGDHTANAGWEQLERNDFTISVRPTNLAVDCYIVGITGALTAYYDDIRLLPNAMPMDYRVPDRFTTISDIYLETSGPTVNSSGNQSSSSAGEYGWNLIPKLHWTIMQHDDGFPYIHFTSRFALVRDRHMMLVGSGYRTDTVAVGTNIEFDPQLIAYMAAAEILRGRTSTLEDRARYQNVQVKLDEMWRTTPRARFPHGARRVRL